MTLKEPVLLLHSENMVTLVRYDLSGGNFCPVVDIFSKSGKKKKFLKRENLPELENLMM